MTTAGGEAGAGVELEAGEDLLHHPGEAEMTGRGRDLRLMEERDTTVVVHLRLLLTEREIIIAGNCRPEVLHPRGLTGTGLPMRDMMGEVHPWPHRRIVLTETEATGGTEESLLPGPGLQEDSLRASREEGGTVLPLPGCRREDLPEITRDRRDQRELSPRTEGEVRDTVRGDRRDTGAGRLLQLPGSPEITTTTGKAGAYIATISLLSPL